jgi:hypothetical protein
MNAESIIARLVAVEERSALLSRHFGARARIADAVIPGTLKLMCEDYRDSSWSCYQLSNGGFYMAPNTQALRLKIPTHHFEDTLSADAAGIVTCLIVFTAMALWYRDKSLAQRYVQLREFASVHPEAQKIARALG